MVDQRMTMGFDLPDAGRPPVAPPSLEHPPEWPPTGPPAWPPTGPPAWLQAGPPGWPAPPPDPSPDTYRDSRRHSIVARVFIGLSGAVALISAVCVVGYLGVIRSISGTDPYSVDAVLAEDERAVAIFDALGWVEIALLVLSAIAFIAWLVRALSNVRPLTGRQPRHTRRGAIGWWFVPILSVVMPYRVVREVHESIDPAARAGQWRWLRVTWWLVWVLALQMAAVASRLAKADVPLNDAKAYEPSLLASIVGEAGTAFAAVLVIVLIGRMQSAEDALALGTPAPEAVAPSRRSPWVVPGLAATGIVGILVAAAFVTSGTDFTGTWATYAADDGSFTVELPGTPVVRSTDDGQFHELDRGVSVVQVRVVDLGTDVVTRSLLDESALAWVEDEEILEPTRETILDHRPARRLRYVDQDGDEWTQILSGVGHQFVVVSELSLVRGSRSELDRVLETFRFGGDEPREPPSEPELAAILPG